MSEVFSLFPQQLKIGKSLFTNLPYKLLSIQVHVRTCNSMFPQINVAVQVMWEDRELFKLTGLGAGSLCELPILCPDCGIIYHYIYNLLHIQNAVCSLGHLGWE